MPIFISGGEKSKESVLRYEKKARRTESPKVGGLSTGCVKQKKATKAFFRTSPEAKCRRVEHRMCETKKPENGALVSEQPLSGYIFSPRLSHLPH
jgi:hypothetical protein